MQSTRIVRQRHDGVSDGRWGGGAILKKHTVLKTIQRKLTVCMSEFSSFLGGAIVVSGFWCTSKHHPSAATAQMLIGRLEGHASFMTQRYGLYAFPSTSSNNPACTLLSRRVQAGFGWHRRLPSGNATKTRDIFTLLNQFQQLLTFSTFAPLCVSLCAEYSNTLLEFSIHLEPKWFTTINTMLS